MTVPFVMNQSPSLLRKTGTVIKKKPSFLQHNTAYQHMTRHTISAHTCWHLIMRCLRHWTEIAPQDVTQWWMIAARLSVNKWIGWGGHTEVNNLPLLTLQIKRSWGGGDASQERERMALTKIQQVECDFLDFARMWNCISSCKKISQIKAQISISLLLRQDTSTGERWVLSLKKKDFWLTGRVSLTPKHNRRSGYSPTVSWRLASYVCTRFGFVSFCFKFPFKPAKPTCSLLQK